MLTLMLIACFLFVKDGLCLASTANTCNPPKVSLCSECSGYGLNLKCYHAGHGQYCFKQQTYTSTGVATIKGVALESECRGNISKSSLIDPNCKLPHPPIGTVCYDCCTSCSLSDLRCNDADVIDDLHIPDFVHQAAQVASTATTYTTTKAADSGVDPAHITSANRHEPICEIGDFVTGYNTTECPDTHPFCMNDVFYDAGGVEKVIDATKRCVSLSECIGEWWHKSKDRKECQNGDLTHLSDGNILCHYCCLSDVATACNQDVRLTNNYHFDSLIRTTPPPTGTIPAYHTCPNGWLHHGNSCYMFSTENKTWSEAAVICQAFHGELAIVETHEENHFIVHHLQTQGNFYNTKIWLDGTDRALENHWVWAATLKRITYTNWFPGQPDDNHSNEDCLALDSHSYFAWTDENCDKRLHFICELQKHHH